MFSKKSPEPTTRLRELSGSDFTIAKDQPDIRGWDVRDAHGRKFGTVSELIFDIRANKVRYMVLNIIDTPELELEKRRVMVPIGFAELDPSDNDVLLPEVNAFQLRALPRYDNSTLGAKAERDISVVFGKQPLNSQQPLNQQHEDVDEQFYNNEHFNEENLYRRRRQQFTGDVQQHPERAHPDEIQRHREMELKRASQQQQQQQQRDPREEAYRKGYEDALRDQQETEEEYFRRTGKRRL